MIEPKVRWRRARWVLSGITLIIIAGVSSAAFLLLRNPIETKPLPKKNPTSYVFPDSLVKIDGAIRKAFEKRSYRGMGLAFEEDKHPLAENIFSMPGNENDAYLYTFHEPIGRSASYFVSGHPCEYIASFQLHLTAESPKETRVEIVTHKPEVIAGKRFGWGPCGPGMANRYMAVPPTTIEEYEILLRIGNALGVGDMPKLTLPGTLEPGAKVSRDSRLILVKGERDSGLRRRLKKTRDTLTAGRSMRFK